jgi:TolB-like protein/DNA-binding winged helix-turn-helix (wHTH) protein
MALAMGNDLNKERESNTADGYFYRFDQFALDSRKRTLSCGNLAVPLTAKAFDVLLFLARHPNRLVTKEELLQAVWGDTFVEDGNITQYISHLRKTLGDNSEDARLIVTIARKGYQFTADVTVGEAADIARPAAVQVPTAEGPQANTQAFLESPADEAVPKVRRYWRKAAFVSASAVLLVVVCFASWRRFSRVTPPSSQKIMLAVLPFENLTGDPNREYLADGLTEEMISQLSRLDPEQLGVIARTSVMAYKHKDRRLDEIGRDLSVQYVLENSLRESGNQLRLTAQLVDMKNQTHLWSHDYDYPTKDIFSIEDDVSKAVAREIQLRLTSQQQAELGRRRPANPEAFDAYMQGFYFFERNSDEDTNRSAKSYERAVQLEPDYALAWVGLSRARHWQAVRGLIPSEEGRRLAREAVVRALEISPNLATAHIQMGRIKRQDDFDFAAANACTQRGLALEPENPEIVRMAGFSALILGRFGEALSLDRRAIELDPFNAESWETLGETQFFVGQLEEAEVNHKRALGLKPDLWFSHYSLSQTYILQGRPRDALPEIDRVQQQVRDWGLYLHAVAYYALDQRKESDTALRELIAEYQGVDDYSIARVYAFRNQPDEAFAWLDRGYARNNDGLIQMKIDPLLKNLHRDPRYAALLTKLSLSQ